MEMGRRDMKRGGTKKQSGSGFSAKSKKGMLKKLNSSRHKDYYEFSSSDLENEVSRKKKKSKLLKKNFKDSNGVVHASVPRKLRSAMKKRNLESVSKLSSASSASKRVNRSKTGIESCLIKKENQEMEGQGIVHESISKDEKEVAETLYGLAGMFTETDSTDKKNCDDHLSNEKETSKVDSSLIVETDFTKTESVRFSDEMPLEQSDKQRGSTRMVDFIDRLKQSSFVNATDSSSVTTRAMETKVATTSDADYKCNGLALWPGLSSGSQVLSKPSLSAKLPPWMDQAIISPPSKNASLLNELLRIQPRKLKKCASHIYISRLIKVLQNRKSSSPATLNQTEQRSSEMSERVLPNPVTTITDFKTMVSPPKRYQNPHLRDINRTHNQKPAQEEDMTKLALELYGPNTSQKQSYDFLSLSSSGASSQSHFQLQNSFPQYPSTSASSSHQVQQISPYLPSRYQTAYNANQQQQQQLQKRLWAASQYRNTAQSSNQYSIQQPLHVGGSSQRYNNNVTTQQQQQHRLMAAMSHYHNNNPLRIAMNRQEHRFPLIYEDTRTPLQLLCKEQT